MISALDGKRLIAPFYFKGHCDTRVFNAWLKDVLLPIIPQGKTIILDNASFHKSPRTKSLIESKGCFLKFLPTYSPDLNPIEQQWAILKAPIRKHRLPSQSLASSIDSVFEMYY